MKFVESALRRGLNHFGYDLHRLDVSAPAPVREVVTVAEFDPWKWLRRTYNFGTLLDIGANKGDYGAFIAKFLKVQRAYFFEPQTSCLPLLKEFTKELSHAEIVQIALTDAPGVTPFYETNANPSSSMLHLAKAHLEAFPEVAETRSFEVEVARLDDVIASRETPGEIIIKIDVQGVEDRVIRGGRKTFGRARLVLIEMSYVECYDGQSLFEEVHDLLVECGLRFSGIKNQVMSSSTNQPLFGHCIYLRPEQ